MILIYNSQRISKICNLYRYSCSKLLDINKNSRFYKHILDRCYSKSWIAEYKQTTLFRPDYNLYLRNVYFTNFKRNYSNDDKQSLDEGGKLLADHPLIMWPSFIQTIRNWILSAFIIKPYYDSTFTIESFMDASVKAICKVTQLMSAGKFDALEGMMDKKTLDDFRNVYKTLNTKERIKLSIVPEDIILKTLLMLGLIFEDAKDESSQQRVFLEITMLYHVYQGLEDYIQNKTDFSSIKDNIDPADNLVLNFRFFKEITKGTNDHYIINSLNYFKPLKAVEKS